jgi:regulator of PEP synthase PpsR (kinase-PPPase family)
MTQQAKPPAEPPPVYVVSGSTGSSGELVVHTALAQFVDRHVPVVPVPRVRTLRQVRTLVARAAADGGTVVHTLVDPRLRAALVGQAGRRGITAIDLMGPLLEHLAQALGQEPVGQPGLYRQLHESYLHRVNAINFAMRHDDGLQPEGLVEADVVLLGVSRTGKTPVTMYVAVQGWRVANVPVCQGQELPEELAHVTRRRIVGLTIDAEQLYALRRSRQRLSQGTLPAEYASLSCVQEELDSAERLFRRLGCAVIDVTGKPIESTAEEVLALVGGRAG